MADDDRLPRFSSDLIDYLDEAIRRPDFPQTADGFAGLDDKSIRRAAFTAGARELVDFLLAWRQEEFDREEQAEAVPDGPKPIFPRLFGADGFIREVLPPRDVDR